MKNQVALGSLGICTGIGFATASCLSLLRLESVSISPQMSPGTAPTTTKRAAMYVHTFIHLKPK